MSDARLWHRLFGRSLEDFFTGLPVRVELEVDLSLRQQLLDVVVVRADPATPLPVRLPDGLEALAAHNLITFKSHREPLDGWALLELLGHYVNYRKQAGPTMRDLPPAGDFRLYAVCVRSPRVVTDANWFRPVRPGVYDLDVLGTAVRVVVVHELPLADQNALLHVFSVRAEALQYGLAHYRPRSGDTSTLLLQLWGRYSEEEHHMPDDTVQEVRDAIRSIARRVPARELLKGLTPPERLDGLTPPERLDGLTPPERLDGLTPADLLAALPADKRAALRRLLQADAPPAGG